MPKQRLDVALTQRKLAASRSQSENWIKLGKVLVNGQVVMKPGHFVGPDVDIKITAEVQYVSRAGLKLESVADVLKLDFRNKVVLDVGSSTGGFTDFALRHGAKKVYAVDVGTDQMHPSLRHNKQVELHEKTDIRDYLMDEMPDIVVIDVSFISLREVLPHIYNSLSDKSTQVVAMVKPQFEVRAEINQSTHAERSRSTVKMPNPSTGSGFCSSRKGENVLNKGVIKNDSMRRQILKDFEDWSRKYFVIQNKRDSDVAGAKGNQERFYLLRAINKIK
jgi:23S rRNA (cytidine1920-2'-O)/16S rRNA (cytidine1409-2'-O)-methyltransferase